MKILFVTSDNNYTSGAFLSMVKLNQLLNSKFNINTFVVLPNEGDGNVLLDEINVPYEIVSSCNWVVDIERGKTKQREREKEEELLGNENAIRRISEIILEQRFDIVHINTSYSYVGALAAISNDIPFVWHIREFLEEDQCRKIWDTDKGYQLMNNSTAVIAISHSIYKKYWNIIKGEKLHLMYNGIDKVEYYKSNKKVFQNEIIEFGIVGGIVPHKGQKELICACGLLKKNGFSQFRLSIVGKGKENYIESLKQLARENDIYENVDFVGPQNEISKILQLFDILFVCSRNEAFGRVTVEGMMSGCIVIGSDTAGTNEILSEGKNGYLYPQGDFTCLTSVIEYVLKHKEDAENIRIVGQKEAIKKYTAIKNAKQIVKLYKSIYKEGFQSEK